jgi:hypothetical protein
MSGLKVANIAAAMWPYLAKSEPDRSQPVRDQGARPEWGKSNGPMWSEPRPIPSGLDRVPGLRKVNR